MSHIWTSQEYAKSLGLFFPWFFSWLKKEAYTQRPSKIGPLSKKIKHQTDFSTSMRREKALYFRVFWIRELTFDRVWGSNFGPFSKKKCIFEGLKYRTLFQQDILRAHICEISFAKWTLHLIVSNAHPPPKNGVITLRSATNRWYVVKCVSQNGPCIWSCRLHIVMTL